MSKKLKTLTLLSILIYTNSFFSFFNNASRAAQIHAERQAAEIAAIQHQLDKEDLDAIFTMFSIAFCGAAYMLTSGYKLVTCNIKDGGEAVAGVITLAGTAYLGTWLYNKHKDGQEEDLFLNNDLEDLPA